MTPAIDPHDWLQALLDARRERIPGVLVTVSDVVGHSPRDAGAKMFVTATTLTGTVGGGNVEAVAIDRARRMLAGLAKGEQPTTQTWTDALTEHARDPQRHGRQCCGGRVSLLFEPMVPHPSVAIVGMGHVGMELAHILARHAVELHLVDSRENRLTAEHLAQIRGQARVVPHHDVIPEAALAHVPRETHVVIMTHDHAEDFAVLDAVLRNRDHFDTVGLIGSTAKWRRFHKRLRDAGHSDAALAGVSCPIGIDTIAGKEPETVALSIAAALLATIRSRASTDVASRSRPGAGEDAGASENEPSDVTLA